MRNLKLLFFVLALFISSGGQNINAQTSLRQEALKKLSELTTTPPKEKNYVYKISVPPKAKLPPENPRLDIVYKIGHYDFQYIALRFEKEKNADSVNVTRFIYGSALEFWKKHSEYSKGDAYIAEQGKLSTADFEKLLNLAYLLYQSNINKEFVDPKPVARRSKGRRYGVGYGTYSASWSGSSGDGRIILNLLDAKNNFFPIIQESGTLHEGKLAARISNGYKKLRTHIFWEIFQNYLEKNNIFTALDKTKAEEIAVARLEEAPMIDEYTDYYRQALYVEFLGEFGSVKALPILKKLSEGNSLEKDWDEYLKARAEKSIEKIKKRG